MKKIQKKTTSKQKKVTKKTDFWLRHPLVIPVTTFLLLFFVGMIVFVVLGATTQGASDARIVSVYDQGEQRTVTTRAKTVQDLLDRLEINLVDEDIVEPAKDSLILEDETRINIYRARPVQLNDGDRTITVFTAHQAPRLVAIQAGIDLYPEDKVSFERIDNKVLENNISEKLTIDRSQQVQLNLYGVIKTFRTTDDTVEELLISEGVQPEEDETVQPSAGTKITDGMLISVNRPGVKTVAIEEEIEFDTEIKNDDTIEAGKSRTEIEGVNGLKATIYAIEEDDDGNEINRKLIQEVIVKNPVTKVILRGTKIVQPSFNSSVTVSGDKAALMAAAGISESDFGYADYIISKESGWRPGAANSYSGAYGLCQALPASKMASAGGDYLTNPVTQLRWCSGYAQGRYGSWGGAYSAWLAQGWW